MNASNATANPAEFIATNSGSPRRWEMLGFAVLVAIFSGSVLFGTPLQSMMFRPDAVVGGEWWRLLTHPFVHVTWYHLLLDASAFFMLYHGLLEDKISRRLLYVVAGAAGSLGLSWLAAPAITTQGLCGLSGIAHGLMAVSAVELMRTNARLTSEWKIGAFTFAVVVGKAAWEAITGHVLFGFLYFRMVGNPITISHAGGIIGALLAALLLSKCEATEDTRSVHE
ncbi:MAG TPA: rhombosortase [Candidatus Paceibacterota bacterium]|nr:rhombosortase [Candidatus Paceibacterota bacterium]